MRKKIILFLFFFFAIFAVDASIPDTTVKIHRVNLGEVPEAILTPERNGKYFSEIIEVDNSSSTIEELLDVYCHKLLDGQEIVAKESGSVFVPKTPEIYEHDADGNLIKDGKFEYQWDGENRLVNAESRAVLSDRQRIENNYDYTNRRTSKNVYGWVNDAWQLSKTEKYDWNGWQLIGIFNDSNHLVRSYCWGENGELVSDTDVVNGKTYLAVYDGNKNIVGYVDASNGTLVASYEYDAFGRIICKSGSKADDFNFRFSSYFFDSETGLVYFGYRYYNPETGRFLSRDPIGEQPENENPYRITTNDLINKWDILGLETYYKRSGGEYADICVDEEESPGGIGDVILGLLGWPKVRKK